MPNKVDMPIINSPDPKGQSALGSGEHSGLRKRQKVKNRRIKLRQIAITKTGAKGAFKIQNNTIPEPSENEVTIRVKNIGINFAEVLARKGLYPDAPKVPFVPGWEISGIVIKTGKKVDTSMLGKPVFALTDYGGYADTVNVPIDQVVEKPEILSFEEAASLIITYLGAYHLLVVMGALRKGESVLIQNAGGGVGLAALDIAKRIGAVTYGTASPWKHRFLKEKGYDHVVDYRSGNWMKAILKQTDGKGVDLAIDAIGGRSWKNSYKMLRVNGRLGMYGTTSINSTSVGKLGFLKLLLQTPLFHPLGLIYANKSVFGVHTERALLDDSSKFGRWIAPILGGVSEGWIRPHVDKVFDFVDVSIAHAYVEARKNIGKIVLKVDSH